MLRSIGEHPVVVDYSSRQLELLRAFGIHVYFGDATRPDLLHAAGIDGARLLVVAVDGKEQITRIVDHVARHHPGVHIVARAVDRHHVYELFQAGADDIIRETFDSAVRSGRSAYEALGFSRGKSELLAKRFVESDKRHLRDMAEAYRPDIVPEENAEFRRLARELTERLHAEMRQRRDEVTAARRSASSVPEDRLEPDV